MKKRIRGKIKNIILVFFFVASLFLGIHYFGELVKGGFSWIYLGIVIVCAAYLVIFGIANYLWKEQWREIFRSEE